MSLPPGLSGKQDFRELFDLGSRSRKHGILDRIVTDVPVPPALPGPVCPLHKELSLGREGQLLSRRFVAELLHNVDTDVLDGRNVSRRELSLPRVHSVVRDGVGGRRVVALLGVVLHVPIGILVEPEHLRLEGLAEELTDRLRRGFGCRTSSSY